MILRFMGDLPEPTVIQHEQTEEEEVSLRKRIYNTFSRKTSKSKLEKEVNFNYDPETYEGEAEVMFKIMYMKNVKFRKLGFFTC